MNGYDTIIDDSEIWSVSDVEGAEAELLGPQDDLQSVVKRIEKKRAEMDLWHGFHEMKAKMKIAEDC